LPPLAPQVSQIDNAAQLEREAVTLPLDHASASSFRCKVHLQSRCCASADALAVAGLADRLREIAALAAGGRSLATVAAIVFVPVGPQEDTPTCRWLNPVLKDLGNGH